jgi:hypothetical protein
MSERFLRAREFAQLLGVGERRARQVIGQLEGLGFRLQVDAFGARRVPEALAVAVREAREWGRPLSGLVHQVELEFWSGGAQERRALEALVEVMGELAVLREVVGALAGAVEAAGPFAFPPIDWRWVGVPRPRTEL